MVCTNVLLVPWNNRSIILFALDCLQDADCKRDNKICINQECKCKEGLAMSKSGESCEPGKNVKYITRKRGRCCLVIQKQWADLWYYFTLNSLTLFWLAESVQWIFEISARNVIPADYTIIMSRSRVIMWRSRVIMSCMTAVHDFQG